MFERTNIVFTKYRGYKLYYKYDTLLKWKQLTYYMHVI